MLHEVHDADDLTRRWAGRSLPRRVMAQWLRQGAAPKDPQPRWFTDDPAAPQVALRLHTVECWVQGPPPLVAAALADLHAGRLSVASPWPDAGTEAAWAEAGRRELHLGRSPRHALDSACAVGFSAAPEEAQPYYCANPWYVAGRPRFAHLVRHACRVVYGEELLDAMLASGHSDNVHYLRACLRQGPSFVCEVAGGDGRPVPVCTSFTHLGGPMGGIYTPEEHRGQGYGKSLTALQVDTMLGLQVDGRHLRGPMCWSKLVWE
jgi:hypothetical protein